MNQTIKKYDENNIDLTFLCLLSSDPDGIPHEKLDQMNANILMEIAPLA